MVMLVIWMIAAGVAVIVVTMIVVVMMVVVVMRVIMAVARRAALGLGIGAAFGIERRLKRDHAGAQTLDHCLDHRIAADAQRLWHYLGRQMAVAEVPGDAGQGQRVGGSDFRQRFGLGDHLNHAPVLEPQPIAAAQHCRFREVEQEFEPADAGHGDAPAMALVEVEHHRVGRSARPMACGYDFVSALDHCTFRLGRPRHWEIGAALSEFERDAKQTPAGL